MKLLSIFVLISLLSACGGGSSTFPFAIGTTSSNASLNVINGIVVPPDPGEAADATLAGVDSDGNGIRDEIDRWIATKYGNKPGSLAAIRWSAKASQKQLTSNPTTQAQALAVIYENMDIGGCIGRKLDLDGIGASKYFNEELIRTFNTRERLNETNRIFDLAGMIVRDVSETTVKCPF